MKRKMKKLLCGALVAVQVLALTTMTAFAKPDWPNNTGIQAEAGALMDVDSGTLIFGQNSHVAYPPASITKLLTALVVLEHVEDLSQTVTFSEYAMMNVEADSGNKLSLEIGDTMTVEDALHALLLQSVNQAANALAEHTAGSMDAFVDMMNAKIAELGCTDSHFDNPSGLNGDTQNVSAYDMALIACAAFENDKLLEISSTKEYKIGAIKNHPEGITVRQEHRLVVTDDPSSEYYCPEAVAGKTGYLLKAGNTLVTYAEKDGRRLVSVVLKGTRGQYFLDGKELLRFGFAGFENVDIAANETNYVTGDAPVDLGGVSYAPTDLMIEAGSQITLPKDATFADAEMALADMPENHPEGAVGLLQYTYNERKIGQAYLMLKNPAVETGSSDVAGSTTGVSTESLIAEGQQMVEEINGTSWFDKLFGKKDKKDSEQPESQKESKADETDASKEDSKEASAEVKPEKKGGFPVLLTVIAIVIGAAAGAGFYWIQKERKREAQEAARRRERRRQRLMEDGKSDEFEQLMAQRKSRRH